MITKRANIWSTRVCDFFKMRASGLSTFMYLQTRCQNPFRPFSKLQISQSIQHVKPRHARQTNLFSSILPPEPRLTQAISQRLELSRIFGSNSPSQNYLQQCATKKNSASSAATRFTECSNTATSLETTHSTNVWVLGTSKDKSAC